MEFAAIAILIVLVVFGLPITAIVRTSRLETKILFLEKSVRHLKEELAAHPATKSSPAESPTPKRDRSSVSKTKADEVPPAPAATHVPESTKTSKTTAKSPPPPSSPSPASAASQKPTSLEETVGTRWTIWVGGLALALGGVFLVRYSIEYGLLGPKVRLGLATLMALALTSLGEFLRRRDIKLDFAGDHAAHVPAVLTAIGVLTGFGVVYAAFALYHFISPLIAFVLLAAVSVAGLALSSVHGPGLAALGLAGSYATPILAGGDAKNTWGLLTYVLFVTAATYGAARLRGWLWLAVAATIGAIGWAGLILLAWSAEDALPIAIYTVALSALALYFLAAKSNEPVASGDVLSLHDLPGLAGLAAISLLAAALLRFDGYSTLALCVFIIIALLHLASAWRWPDIRLLAPWSALLTSLAVFTWHIPLLTTGFGPFDADMGLVPVAPPGLMRFLLICTGLSALFGAAGFAGALKRGGQMIWPGVSVVTPLIILVLAYWRATDFAHSFPFGLAAVGLGAAFAGAAEYLHRTKPQPDQALWSEGIYLSGAFAALALAFTMVLDKGWLTVAIALLCPALAWVEGKRPVPILRPIAAVLAAIVAVRLVWQPIIMVEPGQTPIFNWLLYAYGIPAIAFASAAHMFGQRKDDRTVQTFEGAAIIFTAALVTLQVRHLLNDGDILSTYFDLTELSVHTLVWLGLSLGLRRLDIWRKRIIAHYAAIIFGIAGVASILIGHLVAFNPLVTGDSIGTHSVFNILLLAYLLPGIFCGFIYAIDPSEPRMPHVKAMGLAALVLIFAWLSLQVRSLFAGGGVLNTGIITDSEWYVYSAVWLIYGIVLLGAGIKLGSAALRHGAFAVVVLTIIKAFLFDMSNLTGIYRALSLIGLGAVLIGIGYFYQKVLFPQGKASEKETVPDEKST